MQTLQLCFVVALAAFLSYPYFKLGLVELNTNLYGGTETESKEWHFLAVTDKDHGSRHPHKFSWDALLLPGVLTFDTDTQIFHVAFPHAPLTLSSSSAYGNRSMELSALEFYRGHLMTFCDRSGLVYYVNLSSSQVQLKTMVRTGDGKKPKPFKTEWATLKDNLLYIGSTGKEWTNPAGEILHQDLKWVKTMDASGRFENLNWENVFDKLREISKTKFPGYLIHEAVVFDHRTRKWVFAPRKLSTTVPYADETDVLLSANTLMIASEDFQEIQMVDVGPLELDWGFTAIKPLPYSHPFGPQPRSYFIGIKAKELLVDGEMVHGGSKMVVFDITGKLWSDFIYLPGNVKYEGLTIIPGGRSFEEIVELQGRNSHLPF